MQKSVSGHWVTCLTSVLTVQLWTSLNDYKFFKDKYLILVMTCIVLDTLYILN